jgi:hypothetical protein
MRAYSVASGGNQLGRIQLVKERPCTLEGDRYMPFWCHTVEADSWFMHIATCGDVPMTAPLSSSRLKGLSLVCDTQYARI